MNRRRFLRNTSLSLPLMLNGFKLTAMQQSPLFNNTNEDNDRVLVLIYLNDGNDGLSTIYPLNVYDQLANARNNILIPQNQLVSLTADNALNPNFAGVKQNWDNGQLAIIQSVGYPNQNRSHFRSVDIWNTASEADEVKKEGWLGRYFETLAPDYPTGYPNAVDTDPFSIIVGPINSETCEGSFSNYNVAVENPLLSSGLLVGADDTNLDTPYGHELQFLRETVGLTNAYSELISNSVQNINNQVAYPDDNELAQKLKNVALMIKGGLKTKVYIVELTGFDMHYSQCSENDPLQGRHAELLTSLGDAMKVFQADLNAMQVDERVVTMTFSEFGRRIKSNASYGTDHGDAAPLFISGTCINPGFFGDNPEIPEDTELAYGVAMQHDFRNVYGSILEDWFEVPVETVKNLLFQNYVKIPFLNPCTVVNATSDYKPALYDIEVNPNPAIEYIDIKFNCKDEHVRLSLFNGLGQLINTLLNRKMTKGTHSNRFSVSLLPPGVYYVHFTFQNGVVKTKMFTKLAI